MTAGLTVVTGDTPPAASARPGQAGDPYCRCADAGGPHVHCPWGGMHIELAGEATGLSRMPA